MNLHPNLDETTMIPTNMKLIIPLQPLVSSIQSTPTSLLTSTTNSYFSEENKKKYDDDNVQVEYELLE